MKSPRMQSLRGVLPSDGVQPPLFRMGVVRNGYHPRGRFFATQSVPNSRCVVGLPGR